MTTTINLQPEAYIAIGRNRQKIYPDTKIYLKGGTEFQLELFNGTAGVIAAKIYINDEPISNSLIVLRPGVREFLDRYIDDNKKFLFDTYTVEASPAAKAAIAKNGNIRVEFFKTSVPAPIVIPIVFPNNLNLVPYTFPNNPYCGTTLTTSNNSYYCNTSNNTSNLIGGVFGSLNEKSIKTGIIEGGVKSDQNFTNYNGEFDSWPFFTQSYQILPISAKPVEISKIRNYCSECSNRIRKTSWHFCPSCGTRL